MNLNIGDVVKATVDGLTTYGIFINYNDYRGLIHISEISEHYVEDIAQYVSLGEVIDVKIIDINEREKQIKGSIKNLDYIIEKEKNMNHGFTPLKQALPNWIAEKMNEYDDFE